MRISTIGSALVAVLLLGTVACSNGAAHLHPSASATSTQLHADAANQRLAQLEVARSFDRMRLPAGSRRLPGQPSGVPANRGFAPWQDGRVAWLSVPLNLPATWTYLRAHPPTRMHWGGGYGKGQDTILLDLYQNRMPDPAAFAGPSFLVTVGDVGGHTLVEAFANVQPRHVRPAESLVGPGVTSIQVTGTHLNRTFTDATTIARLRAAANRMYGSSIVPETDSCPPPVPGVSVTEVVKFNAGPDVLEFRWPPGCFTQITVVHDGRTLGVTLDPVRFSDVLDRVLSTPSAK